MPHDGQVYLGVRGSAYNADGTTRLYESIFTIFPQTPPFRYQGRERLVLGGLCLPLSRLWTAEAAAGYKDEPNRLELSESGSAAQVLFPLRDSGVTSSLAIRRQLTGDTALFLALSGERLSSKAPVEREGGRQIGEALTTHREAGWGTGWQKAFGPRRTLGLFWETAQERWETGGAVPNPADLQIQYALTSDLHYGAQYALTRHAFGINWSQQDRRQRSLQASVQLLALQVHAEAAYDIRFYGLPQAGRTSYTQNNLRVAVIHVGYAFPLRPVQLGLEASQLIPLS